MWRESFRQFWVVGWCCIVTWVGGRKPNGFWCCTHGLWDKCVTQLFRIFHSSFVSWDICWFSLTLAFTNVYSANQNVGDFKAPLIFKLKQREKSEYFSRGSQSSLLPKTWRGKHGVLLFKVMGRENQTAPWPLHRQRAHTHGQIISANKSQGCGWVSDSHLAAAT